jgi:beta-glucosidase
MPAWYFSMLLQPKVSSTVQNSGSIVVPLLTSYSRYIGIDRPNLRDSFSDTLVRNVASRCSNTIVTIHNAGIRLVDDWIDHPNVTAVVFGHLPGQDSGQAIVDILYGEVSPSGKLPYTVARNESDYGPLLAPVITDNASDYRYFPQDNFSEGVYIDYRAFDQQNIEPRFEFGFGLTYTTFEYSDLQIIRVAIGALAPAPSGSIIPGGREDLWDTIFTISAKITNTGSTEAAEIAQLYIGIPCDGQPIRQLRGFEKRVISPGESVTTEFPLKRRDLSIWNVATQQWELVSGKYRLYVGASSRNLPLTGEFEINEP